MAPLPPRDQRHPWLRYQIEGYTKDIMHNYEHRLDTIFGTSVNRVHVLDFVGLTEEMRETLAGRTCKMSDTEIGLHTAEEMEEDGFETYWLAPSYVYIKDPVRRLCHRMISCSISGRGQTPEKVTGINLFYLRRMDHGTANVLYLLAQFLFMHAEGRKSGASLRPERKSADVSRAPEDAEGTHNEVEGDKDAIRLIFGFGIWRIDYLYNLSYVEEPEAILDRQDRVMRKKTISFVKILWRNHPEREATWETEESIRTSYPHFLP
nr:hypothetical protein [Tanacetum cinerariifolium]